MSAENISSFDEVSIGSERSFGLVFGGVFLLIGLFPLLKDGEVRIWSLGVAVIFFALSFLAPKALKWPNYFWFKLGMLLGKIVTPVVMGLLYIITVVPIGFLMKLLGKDILNLKMDSQASTYWVERKTKINTMKNQF